MKQFFIMLVGYSQSGKSTLAKKLVKIFPNQFVRIDSDTIHNFLNTAYNVFRDDNTVQGKSYDVRQKTTKAVQGALIDVLITEGYCVILDSCNLLREKRIKILQKLKMINKNIITIIIYNKILEKQLYINLLKADQGLIKRRKKPAWIDLYEKVQKVKFEEPSVREAKHMLTYTKQKEKTVINKLNKIING